MLTVWVDSWQQQCCGEAFRVGSEVEWVLADHPDRGFLSSLMGAELAATVTHAEEHHGGVPDDTPPTPGTVRRIRVVRCRYSRNAEGPARVLMPVPGTATLSEVTSADGWDPDEGPARFIGYLVDVDLDSDQG